MLESDLYKSVLRGQLEQPTNNSNVSDFESHKTSHHLVLGKRSSTPASSCYSTSLAAANLISNMPPVCRSPDETTNASAAAAAAIFGQSVLDMQGLSGVPPGLHRRLDRSHSEPVWPQQQQLQPQDGRQGSNSSRYKTELCRPFEENGFCKYGDKCQFAHGAAELRTLNRHPKYKTELCRTFHTIGLCPYGPRCHFIHNAEESRVLSPVMQAAPIPARLLGQMNCSPPPLVNQGGGLPHSMGLPTIFDKNSPPSSLHGSPTTHASFFDELTFLQGQLLMGGLADTLNTLSLGDNTNTSFNNSQINYNLQQFSNNGMNNNVFSNNIKNHCSSPTDSLTSTNSFNSSSNSSGNSSPDHLYNNSPNTSIHELLCDSPTNSHQFDTTHHHLETTHHQLDTTHHQLDATHHQLDASHHQLDTTTHHQCLDTPPGSPADSDDNKPRLPIFQSINQMQ